MRRRPQRRICSNALVSNFEKLWAPRQSLDFKNRRWIVDWHGCAPGGKSNLWVWRIWYLFLTRSKRARRNFSGAFKHTIFMNEYCVVVKQAPVCVVVTQAPILDDMLVTNWNIGKFDHLDPTLVSPPLSPSPCTQASPFWKDKIDPFDQCCRILWSLWQRRITTRRQSCNDWRMPRLVVFLDWISSILL
jgi:hypothetical protein